MLIVVTLKRILLDSTLGLCPSTAENNPLPLSPSFSVQCSPYPMLFLVVCHLSNDVSVFQLILRRLLSSILCFPWSIYCLLFERCARPISISLFLACSCYFGSLHNDGDSVCSFDFSHFPFHCSVASFKLLSYNFCLETIYDLHLS